MSEWQPIETAPEGVVILGWSDLEPFPAPMVKNWIDPSTEKETGEDWEYADHLLRKAAGSVSPSHWMPLPEAPK